MSREHRLYLQDMRAACQKIARFVADMSQSQFFADEKTLDAVLKNLEVIGEAARNLPPEIRERHPEVPWRRISGLRDVVVHEYFGIDHDVLWDIIQNKVPALLPQVNAMLDET